MSTLPRMVMVGSAWFLLSVGSDNPAEVLSKRIDRALTVSSYNDGLLSSLVINLSRVYDAPINVENSSIDDGSYVSESIAVELRANETLESALTRLPPAFQSKFALEIVMGQLVFRPRTGEDPSLNHRLSLSMESVSTWEAIKTVFVTANRSGELDQPIVVNVSGTDFRATYKPPAALLEIPIFEEPITFTDVTIREILCAIFDASPINLCYIYYTGLSGDFVKVSLMFRGNDSSILPRAEPTNEETYWWGKETREIQNAYVPRQNP